MLPETKLTKKQKIHSEIKKINFCGECVYMRVEIRHDDECGNGHNSFSITADISKYKSMSTLGSAFLAGGCLHEEIEKHFPEYKPLIRWHLTSTDGPMHYIPNTVFLAGDKDCWGRRKGEPSRFEHIIKFGDSPISHKVKPKFYKFLKENTGKCDFEVTSIEHGSNPVSFNPQYTLKGYGESWHECPFRLEHEADEFCEALNLGKWELSSIPVEFSKGKERQLDAARNAACWPEATDEELSQETEPLKRALADRLLALMVEFKEAVESAGLVY